MSDNRLSAALTAAEVDEVMRGAKIERAMGRGASDSILGSCDFRDIHRCPECLQLCQSEWQRGGDGERGGGVGTLVCAPQCRRCIQSYPMMDGRRYLMACVIGTMGLTMPTFLSHRPNDGVLDTNAPIAQANVGQQIPKFLSLRAIDELSDTNVPIVQTIC